MPGEIRETRILLVDDSPLIHQIYGAQFEEAGFEVIHARDGFEAINLAFTERPDLILLDVNMPRINGYQVCRLLKDHPGTHDIPIIIETSRISGEHVADPKKWSFETGADGFFEKESAQDVIDFIKPLLDKHKHLAKPASKQQPMSEIEIMTSLSHLLDQQLYTDVTRLRELNERKNAFVSNVSHEFKSPLTVMKLNLKELYESLYNTISNDQKAMIQTTIRTIDRLNRLVSDLLDLAKIEAGKTTLKIEKVNLSQLIDEVVDSYSVAIKFKKIDVAKQVQTSNPVIFGDKDRLTQVLINLLYNSITYSHEKGHITLQLLDEGDKIRFVIQDDGPGISKENLEKIFDKFVRVSAEKREGTGLGLPIAQDIVRLHGGKLWAESEEGKGSKFIVLLPKP
jgi:signal transduction histidine kinase